MTDGALFGSSPSPCAWRRADPFPSEDEIADRAHGLFVAAASSVAATQPAGIG